MDNIHRFTPKHPVFRVLCTEKVFKHKGERLAAYVELASYSDELGCVRISSKQIKEIWKRWGFTHKTTYAFLNDLINVDLLNIISKESRKGEWLLIIPEIYRSNYQEVSGIKKNQPNQLKAPHSRVVGKNKEQIGIDNEYNKNTINTALNSSNPSDTSIIKNNPKTFIPSNPQKPVNGGDDLFTGLSTDLSTDKVLILGGSKRGGGEREDNTGTKEIVGTERKELQQEKIKNKKTGFEFTHPDTGETKILRRPPQDYQFIGKKINILYRDYMENFVKAYPYFERGDQMMQFIKWFDEQLSKRPVEKQNNWWNELHAILVKKNLAAFSDHG